MNKILYRTVLVTGVLFLSSAGLAETDYRDEALKVTRFVEEFVARHDISGSEIEKVHKIIKLAHDKFLFARIDRPRMESWIQDPLKSEQFRESLERLKGDLRGLYEKRTEQLLTEAEAKILNEGRQKVFFGEHDLRVFNDLVRKKTILPEDLPFCVSGAEAVEYGISDGCTTATKTFIVLARAAGLTETRFVATGNVPDYNQACPEKNKPRRPKITINGHFFALVKIQGRWALVNCTYYDPYAADDELRYEIFFRLDGQDVSPEMLNQRILRVPSFQREGSPPPPNKLYVIAVGKDSQDDMDIETYNALMNLSVSGDRDCPDCRYNPFR